MGNKDYIERDYKQAISDFKVSHNENERWECRKRMAKLELLACEFYGYQYLDEVLGEDKINGLGIS